MLSSKNRTGYKPFLREMSSGPFGDRVKTDAKAEVLRNYVQKSGFDKFLAHPLEVMASRATPPGDPLRVLLKTLNIPEEEEDIKAQEAEFQQLKQQLCDALEANKKLKQHHEDLRQKLLSEDGGEKKQASRRRKNHTRRH